MLVADHEGIYRNGGTPPFILNIGPFMEASGSFHAAVAYLQGEEPL